MKKQLLKTFAFCLVGLFVTTGHLCASPLAEHAKGDEKAPVTITEYASFSCSHCAAFYKDVMPELEKRYIATGKVRFFYKDFPLNRYDLRASALAHCLPREQFYPFVKTLFENAGTWTSNPKPEEVLVQYAGLAGLGSDKAKACMDDAVVLDALVVQRTQAIEKYDIKATPTFILNGGMEKIVGAASAEEFFTAIEKALAKP